MVACALLERGPVPRLAHSWTIEWLRIVRCIDCSRTADPSSPPAAGVRFASCTVPIPAQWCLSCVHTQARFSCKKLRNPLRKVPHKDVDLWTNYRGNAGEAARILGVTLFGVTHKLVQRKSRAVKSLTEPIAMTACDLLTQWSINVDCVTVCVAVVRQLHGLLTAGRLYTPTA